MTKKIYIIAGEPSGDFIGSCLMENLTKLREISFVGIGGELMIKQNLNNLFPISEISMMGFFEILPHIFKLRSLIKQTIDDIVRQDPDLLITIDSPGFTYRVAKHIKVLKPDLKIIHVVAPSVWAYKPSRALKYAKVYDHLLALLPFEPPYFEKVGLHCSYIGHPILDQKFLEHKTQSNQGVKTICITLGSRKGEVLRHLPIFAKALSIIVTKYKMLDVIFVLANSEFEKLILDHPDFISLRSGNSFVNLRFSINRLASFASSDIAIAKSGTNTLEIAASRTPMVVAYKINLFSFILIKLMIKIKYASIINIVANRTIIPEFLGFNCRAKQIAAAALDLLSDIRKSSLQIAESKEILKKLGFKSNVSASMAGAKIIEYFIRGKE